jgi:hypothetical protein
MADELEDAPDADDADPMDLDDVHAIDEEPDHFVVTHAERGRFRIAKSALSADVADSMRSIAKGKAAAAKAIAAEREQGEVRRAALGDDVPEDPAADDAAKIAAFQQAMQPQPDLMPQAQVPGADDARATEDALARRAAHANEVEVAPEPGSDADLLDVNRPSTVASVPVTGPQTTRDWLVDLGIANATPGGYQGSGKDVRDVLTDLGITNPRPAPVAPVAPEGMIPASFDPAQSSGVPAVAPAAAQAAPGETQPTPANVPSDETPRTPGAPRTGGTAGAPREPATPAIPPFDASGLNEALRLEKEGIDEHARATSELALRQKAIQDDTNAWMAAQAADTNARIASDKQRLQALHDDLAKNPIQRQEPGIRGAIAMALGAFGAALAGSPNFAMQIINKRIDDDLALQKARRSEKLAEYQRLGLSVDNAMKMLKADKLAEVAGSINSAALQAGSQQAVATGKIAAAKLMADSFKLVDDAGLSHFKAVTAGPAFEAEMKTHALNQEMLRQHARLLAAQTAAEQMKSLAGKTQQDVETAYLSGIPVPITSRAALSKDSRESGVEIGGRLYAAHDPEAAKKARAAVGAATELKSALQKMREFRDTTGRAFGTGTSATADALQKTTQLALKAAGELGTLDSGSQAFLDSLVKNPGAIFTNDSTINASLDALDGWAESRKQATLGAQLVNAPRPITFVTR